MKTSELTGAALDWAVANCEGELSQHGGQVHLVESKVRFYEDTLDIQYTPSTDWSQGGPIIEREGISVATDDVEPWCGFIEDDETNTLFFSGPTPLIAAMRCYVASKMGDEIELPEELR
jgi:hypothetical protein